MAKSCSTEELLAATGVQHTTQHSPHSLKHFTVQLKIVRSVFYFRTDLSVSLCVLASFLSFTKLPLGEHDKRNGGFNPFFLRRSCTVAFAISQTCWDYVWSCPLSDSALATYLSATLSRLFFSLSLYCGCYINLGRDPVREVQWPLLVIA